jgi:hypothetical protein
MPPTMCRNIKTLHHFDPPATPEEIEASALQYVRKLSGMREPSKHNEAVFARAVAEITRVTTVMLAELEAHGPARDRQEEARKARARWERREGRTG